MNSKKARNIKEFLCFVGPALFFFIAIIGAAFVSGVHLSFTDWNGLSDSYNYVGIGNYIEAFKDKEFILSLVKTFQYVFFVVVITNIVAFAIAFGLTRGIRSQGIYRVGFFTPNLIGGVVLGLIWKFVFSTALPIIGDMLHLNGLKNNLLSQPKTAFIALVTVAVWQMAGYLMLIYMAGLVGLPKEVLEAAKIDGANGWVELKSIIVPLIMPSVTICGFMSIKSAFMAYDVNMSLTNGGPFASTKLVAMQVYERAFTSQKFGVGQAEALILFAIVAVITLVQVGISKSKEVDA
ncbi:MAG: sugar ABC transporter permease [Lachnospiraceae bacterium]|nr:sugar ABC transporter permease [Lachnospiraceae bacterium]